MLSCEDQPHKKSSGQFKLFFQISDLAFDKSSSRVIHNTIVQKSNPSEADNEAGATSKIDFTKPPYKRIDFLESLQSAAGKSFPSPLEIQSEFVDQKRSDIRSFLQDVCRQNDVYLTPETSLSKLFDKLFGHFVEPSLIEPTFVMDHPICMSPLAKEHRSKPGQYLLFHMAVQLSL